MLDPQRINRLGDANLASLPNDVIARNQASADLHPWTKKLLLDDFAHRLPGITGSPGANRRIEARAFPPLRIAPGQVQGKFVAACPLSFSYTISGHETASAVRISQPEEQRMLLVQLPTKRPGVRVVGEELVSLPVILLLLQKLQQLHLFFSRQCHPASPAVEQSAHGAARLSVDCRHPSELRRGC